MFSFDDASLNKYESIFANVVVVVVVVVVVELEVWCVVLKAVVVVLVVVSVEIQSNLVVTNSNGTNNIFCSLQPCIVITVKVYVVK